MQSRILIDAIVRQTTVLLAQLSTAAGIRAPLAHVADEVFVSLARELEAQGIGRKVAADMFGLALRTYQRKVQRLEECVTQRGRTLWEAILDHVAEEGSATRRQVLARFALDGERQVVGVLTDLVSSGLLHASGRGAQAVYGVTTASERQMLMDAADAQSISSFAWTAIRNAPGITTIELASMLKVDLPLVVETVSRLVAEGRVQRESPADDAPLEASPLLIPVGSEMGWEAAVFDHFRAVCSAIAAKVRAGRARSEKKDVVGGSTLSFWLAPEHPHWDRVHGLLARVRSTERRRA